MEICIEIRLNVSKKACAKNFPRHSRRPSDTIKSVFSNKRWKFLSNEKTFLPFWMLKLIQQKGESLMAYRNPKPQLSMIYLWSTKRLQHRLSGTDGLLNLTLSIFHRFSPDWTSLPSTISSTISLIALFFYYDQPKYSNTPLHCCGATACSIRNKPTSIF